MKIKNLTAALLSCAILLGSVTAVPAYAAEQTVSVSNVKLSASKKTIYVGSSYTLKLKNADGKVQWKSSKPSVAKVSSKGKVTALKSGTAVITATYNGKKYTCKITVKKKPEVKLSVSRRTLYPGMTYTLTLKNATGKTTWSSSNSDVAKVSSAGEITALKEGTAEITATNSGKKYTCTVTVKPSLYKGEDLGYYITDKATTLSSDRFLLLIPEGIYVPSTIVDDVNRVFDAIEKETGLKFINGSHSDKVTITVKKTDTEAEFADAYSEESGPTISPGDLLVHYGEGLALTHELCHTIHLRNGATMTQVMNEGFATCFAQRVMNSGIFPYYFDSASNYASSTAITSQNAETLFAQEGWEAYLYGWRFVSFLTDQYGTDAFMRIAQRDEFKTAYGYRLDGINSQELIPILKNEFGSDVFDQFVKWVNDPEKLDQNHDRSVVDLSGFKRVNAIAFFGSYKFIDPGVHFSYNNSIVVDYTTAQTYLEKYKGCSCNGIVANLSAEGKSTFSFYSKDGVLLDTVTLDNETDVPVNVKNAALVQIAGDGKPVYIDINSLAYNATFDIMVN